MTILSFFLTLGILLFSILIIFLLRRKFKLKRNERQSGLENELAISMEKNVQHEEERIILMQEIHHRVKNNLQIISSLLKLLVANSAERKIPFDPEEIIDRINSIAQMHELIYKSDDLNKMEISEYLKSIVENVIEAQSKSKKIEVFIEEEIKQIGISTVVPLAIILHELVLNSINYDNLVHDISEIQLKLSLKKDLIELTYSDNGKQHKKMDDKSFGSLLIEIFTEQLDGSYAIKSDESGVIYEFKLKNIES